VKRHKTVPSARPPRGRRRCDASDAHGGRLGRELILDTAARLAAGEAVRWELPGGVRLHVDRPLPFLCVYREPAARDDPGVREFVTGEASFLIVPAAGKACGATPQQVGRLVESVAAALRQRFGGCIVVEIWSADPQLGEASTRSASDPAGLRPAFCVRAGTRDAPPRVLQAFQQGLERIAYAGQPAQVTVEAESCEHPADQSPLMSRNRRRAIGCEIVGLEVRPIYLHAESGAVYPAVLRKLRLGVGRALKQALFSFVRARTAARPEHFYALGRGSVVKGVKAVDRILSEVSDAFQFLLAVTPVNGDAAWQEFRRRRFEANPQFAYRPLAIDPAVLKRRLYAASLDAIEDPTLGELFRQRQDELDRKLTMLADVGTERFRLGSLQVYGAAATPLLELAGRLLRSLPVRSRAEEASGRTPQAEFARRAEEEIAYYRGKCPHFSAEVVIRDDLFAGLLCSGGNLIIGQNARMPRMRLEALLQHEVGTHLVTFYNGRAQPFQVLHAGLAGYESLQEGLAVLSEHLAGGLTAPRLRLLAARVVAVHMMVEGASFIETFRKLDRDYGFDQRTAFTIAMRVYRGGGLTKDAAYLRGLTEVLEYLARGGDLAPLFVGKIAVEHIEFVRELQLRKVLKPPATLPRYLEFPGVAERLAALRAGADVSSLVEE